jgi:hypothetical protein
MNTMILEKKVLEKKCLRKLAVDGVESIVKEMFSEIYKNENVKKCIKEMSCHSCGN